VLHRSGVEEYSKLNDSIYWHDGEGLLREPVHSVGTGLAREGLQTAAEPEVSRGGEHVVYGHGGAAGSLLIRLRIPGWLQSAPTVKLNGKGAGRFGGAGQLPGPEPHLESRRQNRDGTAHAPAARKACPTIPTCRHSFTGRWCWPAIWRRRLDRSPHHRPQFAGRRAQYRAVWIASRATNTAGPVPEIAIPEFRAAGDDPRRWIKPAGQPMTWKTSGQKKDVTLVPLNSLFDRRYAVYWQVV